MTHPLADSTFIGPFTRRNFLKTAGAAAAISSSPWAWGRRTAASDRITIGVIGWGMMGPANTKAFLGQSDCQVVAACDIDKNHLQAGRRHHQQALRQHRTARLITITAR